MGMTSQSIAESISSTSALTDAVTPDGGKITPVSTGQEGLTTFKESSNELQVQPTTTLSRPISDPYNTPTPTQLLSKQYLVKTVTWTAGFAGATLSFPGALLQIVTLSSLLPKRYRFMRANVIVEIKLNSTPYHQGSLIVGWIPQWPGSSALPTTNATTPCQPFLLSGMNGVIISASTQDSVKFKIPYLSAQEYVDLIDSVTGPADGRIATLFIRELNTLTSTQANITASLPINVWAGFDSLEVAGFTSESDRHSREASSKHAMGFDLKPVVSAASKILRKAPVIGEGYGVIADLVNTFAGDLSKPTYNTSQTPVMPVYQKEAALCHANTYAEQISMYPNAYLSQAPTIGGMETSHMTLSELARKPMLTNILTMTSNSAATIYATPLLCGSQGVTTIDTPIGDWLANTALAFTYWRGSIKYALHFCVPSFYSFRARVSLNRQYTTAVADIGDLESTVIDVKGDTWYTFSVPYLYSTLWRAPFDDISGSAGTDVVPKIKIEIMTPIVGSSAPATPVIFVNVFRSGGEDTQFTRPRGIRPGTSSFTSECSISDTFSKPFQGLVAGTTQAIEQGWTMPESAHSISDMGKRRSSHIMGTIPYTTPWSFAPGTSNVNYNTLAGEPFNYWAGMFRWWRGGRVLTHAQPNNLVSLSNDNTVVTWGDGAVPFFTTQTNALYNNESVHIPWYNYVPYFPTNGPGQVYDAGATGETFANYQPLDQFGVSNAQTLLSIQAADDFMLIYPVPFFPCYFAPVNFAPGGIIPLTIPKRRQTTRRKNGPPS